MRVYVLLFIQVIVEGLGDFGVVINIQSGCQWAVQRQVQVNYHRVARHKAACCQFAARYADHTLYGSRCQFCPVSVAGDAAFKGHIGRHIVTDRNAVGCDLSLVQYRDLVMDRVARLYQPGLIRRQAFDQSQVKGLGRHVCVVVVVLVFAVVAVAADVVVVVHYVVIRDVVRRGVVVHLRIAVVVGSCQDLGDVPDLRARRQRAVQRQVDVYLH